MHFLTSAAVTAALLLAPQAAADGLYSKNSAVLQVDSKSWDKLIKNSHVPSLVEFYAPWCGHCQKLKPAYEKAAKSLEGLVNVAAVNCDDDINKSWCGQQGVQGFPTIKAVRTTLTKGKPIIVPYTGDRSAKALVEAAKALLPNHVKRVEDKDLGDWLAKDNSTAKAILFSDKGRTPAQLKAIANDFYGNLNVAQIRDKDPQAAKIFGISDYPTLVVLPGGTKDPVVFDGEMSKIEMANFIKQYAEPRSDLTPPASSKKSKDSKAKSSKASKAYEKAASSHAKEEASEAPRSAASETVEDPDEESPKPIIENTDTPVAVPVEAKPLTTLATEAELRDACLGEKTATCLLAFVPAKEGEADLPEASLTALANLATLQQRLHAGNQHIFPFYVVPGENEFGAIVKKSLGLPEDGFELITVNGKKKWWRQYDSAKGFEVLSVEDWVDAIKFGEVKKQKLPNGLVGEDKPVDEEKSEL